MPELSDAEYRELGKFTYQFGNLERWVTWGIIEAEHISSPKKQKELSNDGFENRLKRLKKALDDCAEKGLIRRSKKKGFLSLGEGEGEFGIPDFDFDQARDLGRRRNRLFHGEPSTRLFIREIRKDRTMHADVVHVNYDTVNRREITVDIPTLEQMTKEATGLAENLVDIVSYLGIAKQQQGIKPLRVGLIGR